MEVPSRQFPDPRFMRREPWVTPPYEASPQAERTVTTRALFRVPLQGIENVVGVVPGVPPRAFTGCPFGA